MNRHSGSTNCISVHGGWALTSLQSFCFTKTAAASNIALTQLTLIDEESVMMCENISKLWHLM